MSEQNVIWTEKMNKADWNPQGHFEAENREDAGSDIWEHFETGRLIDGPIMTLEFWGKEIPGANGNDMLMSDLSEADQVAIWNAIEG